MPNTCDDAGAMLQARGRGEEVLRVDGRENTKTAHGELAKNGTISPSGAKLPSSRTIITAREWKWPRASERGLRAPLAQRTGPDRERASDSPQLAGSPGMREGAAPAAGTLRASRGVPSSPPLLGSLSAIDSGTGRNGTPREIGKGGAAAVRKENLLFLHFFLLFVPPAKQNSPSRVKPSGPSA
ncbi:hypothetical protein MTO96_030075 [Rhipicephalus appendiculatus]